MAPIFSLAQLISLLFSNEKTHVCIHDMSGFSSAPMLRVDTQNRVHAQHICSCAKRTKKGLRLCLWCKQKSIEKAVQKQPYWGMCPLGIAEAVCPIVFENELLGVVYVGNLLTSEKTAKQRIARVASITGASRSQMAAALPTCQACADMDRYLMLAQFISGYILLLYQQFGRETDSQFHWTVELFKNYTDSFFNHDLSISRLARLYHVNSKYAGRLFKSQMGQSYSQYLNHLRIRYAKARLTESDETVLRISMDAGFNNVTYFNRIFKAATGLSPNDYRAQHRR